MKIARRIGIVILLAAGLGGTSPAAAQGELERLESGIRNSNGTPAITVAATQRVYLGAVADDTGGRGVKVLSVRNGGPADRAGLQPQDVIVGAAGRKIGFLSELAIILNNLNPGDRLKLEFMRGTQPLRTEVVLGAAPGTAQLGQPGAPPPSGFGAGRTETIPPPPGDTGSSPSPEGPALGAPGRYAPGAQPFPPNSAEARIQELQRRIDQLEHRVEELEHALANRPK